MPEEHQTAELSPEAKGIARDFAALRFPVKEAMMLEDLGQTLKLSRDLVRSHYKARCEAEVPDEEEMPIHVGDITQNFQMPTAPPAAPPIVPPPPPPSTTPTVASKLPSMTKVVTTVAALIIGSGAVGATVPWLLGAYDSPPVQEVTIPPDSDTHYKLRIGVNGDLPTGRALP